MIAIASGHKFLMSFCYIQLLLVLLLQSVLLVHLLVSQSNGDQ